MQNYDLIVIGSGPAGLMAAINGARAGAKTLVLEYKPEAAKKLYATGNGRCNLTNAKWEQDIYRGGGAVLAREIVKTYDTKWLLSFLEELGLPARQIGDYYYPYNEQAASVVSVLLCELRRLGILLLTGQQAVGITKAGGKINDNEKHGSGYLVQTAETSYQAQAVVIAVGGKASPTHGSDGNFNKVIRSLGHTILLQQSALVPLVMADKHLEKLSGQRLKCAISLVIEGESERHLESGEIIFNKNTISGIPVLQLSRYATLAMAEGRKATLYLDLFPEYEQKELAEFLCHAFLVGKDPARTSAEALSFLVPKAVAEFLVSEKGKGDFDSWKLQKTACKNSEESLLELAKRLKAFPVSVSKDAGSTRAQVSAGGVDCGQITGQMESKLHPGIFFAGEILDVDGTCGGYNLHWAFASGYLAGKNAAASCGRLR